MKTVFATPRRTQVDAPSAFPIAELQFKPTIRSPSPLPHNLLPPALTEALSRGIYREQEMVEEIRLRAERYATLTVNGENRTVPIILSTADLTDILTHLCGGSLYAYSQTINQGYISLPDGIRVGVAGRAVCEGDKVIGVCEITSLCIRLPHRHRSVGGEVCRLFRHIRSGSGTHEGLLIYAPPGEGKTTLLRAVAAALAGGDGQPPLRTVVVDTRGELGFDVGGQGLCLDILRGYPRSKGVEIATRTLSAQLIICDEIGDVEEAMALISTHHGGVPLIATAHGGSVGELLRRTGIRLLHEARLFGAYVGIRRDGRGDFAYRITSRVDADGLITASEQVGS